MIANRRNVGVIIQNYSELDTLCTGVGLTRDILRNEMVEPILRDLPVEQMMESLEERIAARRPHRLGDIHMPLDQVEGAVASVVLMNICAYHPDEFEKQFSRDMFDELDAAMALSRAVHAAKLDV